MSSENSSQYEVLRQGVGFHHHTESEHLVMTGEDRFRFLNGQVTCDVGALEAGASTYGFFTTAKGRIEADVTVLSDGDRLLLRLPTGTGETIRERLRKYIIVDRVEVNDLDLHVFSVVGPNAASVAEALPEGVWRRETENGFEVWSDAGRSEEARAALEGAGAVNVDAAAWERYRVEEGQPIWGRDFGIDHFPQETGLEDAVSYTKGCYLGQEVVARIHYRGGVQRRLRGLHVQPASTEHTVTSLVGADLLFEGKKVGRLTSGALSEHRELGLSIIHDKAPVGASLTIQLEDQDRGVAEVLELPFS